MRQDGYYWVKHKNEWHVALWNTQLYPSWHLSGHEEEFEDTDFDEINEERIKSPNETN